MKKTVILVFSIIILFSFPLNCYAENDRYNSVYDSTPDDIKDILNESEFNISTLEDLIETVRNEGVFSLIALAFSNYSLPFKTITTLFIFSLIGGILELYIEKAETRKMAQIIYSFIICLILAEPLKNLILSVTDCLNSGGVFMFSFLPVFASLMITSSPSTSAIAYTSTTYFFTEITVFISRSVLTPLSTSLFTMSVVSSVSDNIFKNLLSGLKKLIIWTLGLLTSIFTAITSIQSIITSAADSVAIKTGKFIVGSSVPVVGGYVSEVLNTVIGSVSIMRSGIGLYAIIVMSIMFIPVIAELILWKVGTRLCLLITLGDESNNGLTVINAFDDVISILLSVTICVLIGMILSISAIMVFGGVK